MKNIWLFVRLSRPHFLAGAMLLYALGVGIAHYLGEPVNLGIYLVGQVWGSLIQLSTHYLNEYFDARADIDNPTRTPFSGGSGAIGPGKLPRSIALWAGVSCLAFASSLTVVLLQIAHPTPVTLLVMVLIFLGAFFYAVPPLRLESSGYGELVTSLIVANLVPAFAYLIQVGEPHRLLAMVTFPLTAMHMAMLLAIELPDYGNDLKYQKRNLLVRIGWQNGMRMHNVLVISSYLILMLAVALDLPLSIALPSFLTFPVGLLQIWTMNRIGGGARPNWFSLTLVAVLLFGSITYLLAFAFWRP